MNRIDPRGQISIDEDFAAWAAEQGALLRGGKFERVDTEHVAEEIEDLGRSGKYEIVHRMEVLLAHLLKWQFQPEKRSNSWRATIREQRSRIADVLNESPSLRPYPEENVGRAYVIGLGVAITETGLPEAAFPQTCPYGIEQILDPDFLPA